MKCNKCGEEGVLYYNDEKLCAECVLNIICSQDKQITDLKAQVSALKLVYEAAVAHVFKMDNPGGCYESYDNLENAIKNYEKGIGEQSSLGGNKK